MKPLLIQNQQGLPALRFESGREITADFVGDFASYGKPLRGKQELLAKAVGFTGKPLLVLDGTFGLGQDAWTLARLGCRVVGCEQEPLLFELLQKSLVLALENPKTRNVAEKIQLFQMASQEFFGSSEKYLKEKINSIYLDPMFPDSKKTALPKIEMQLLRDWLGHGTESDMLLLEKARRFAPGDEKFRVVVKRPLKAPILKDDYFHQFKGKTIRYDCYKGLKR